MSRPASFNNAPKKAPKNKQRAGKEFEPRVRRGLELLGGWTARFTDTVNVDAGGRMKRTAGAVTPPDLIHINKNYGLLVECKAQRLKEERDDAGAKSISLDRVKDHQLKDLIAFDNVSSRHHGCVAVLWWNGKLGGARVYRAWLIPVSEWANEILLSEKKSVPFGRFDWGTWSRYEMTWRPGKKGHFDPTFVISELGRPA